MRVLKRLAILSTLVGVAACGNGDEKTREALTADELRFLDSLTLTPALEPDTAPPVLSAVELGLAPKEVPQIAVAEAEPEVEEEAAPVAKKRSTTRRSSSPARRSSSSGTYSSGSSAGTYEAPAPVARTETVRHTKRDAAIGAGAGAVIGAVAGGSRNRVKGAVIGAVVGGAAGAVIGHTVDKSTRTVYDPPRHEY